MKYAIIRDHLERYPKSLMCRAMSVSRSGLNKWLNRPESDRAQRKSLYEQKVMETFEEFEAIAPMVRLALRMN